MPLNKVTWQSTEPPEYLAHVWTDGSGGVGGEGGGSPQAMLESCWER